MESNGGKFLIITANVGSLFEEYGDVLRKNWILAFHQLVAKETPLFIALHLQELGGKSEVQQEDDIHSYFKGLSDTNVMVDYTYACSYIDQQCTDNTKYTALACSYFVHKSLINVEQWDFNSKRFKPIPRKVDLQEITNENGTIRKIKFPMGCFSKKAKRLPRKGFAWTRWKICDKVIDLLNIHLSHDACNVNCVLKSPTKYAKYRRRALEYIVERLKEYESDHRILFGDFNVRPDTKALVEYLMKNVASQQLLQDDDGKPYSVIYKSINGSRHDLLKIESRFFEMSSYEAFNTEKVPDLLQFDKELQWIKQDHKYTELDITFQPTYPHKENPEEKGTSFANVRCPSWCDRVIFDSKLLQEGTSDTIYDSFGKDVHLGDHKPVYMTFNYPGVLADQ